MEKPKQAPSFLEKQMELFQEVPVVNSPWASTERYSNYCPDRARLEEELRSKQKAVK